MDATFAVAKRKPEKVQACMGFEPMTSAIPVQRSTNWANKHDWEQVAELVRIKPAKGWWWSYEYMKIIYENSGKNTEKKQQYPRDILGYSSSN